MDSQTVLNLICKAARVEIASEVPKHQQLLFACEQISLCFSERDELKEQIAELEAALRPFANIAAVMRSTGGDLWSIQWGANGNDQRITWEEIMTAERIAKTADRPEDVSDE